MVQIGLALMLGFSIPSDLFQLAIFLPNSRHVALHCVRSIPHSALDVMYSIAKQTLYAPCLATADLVKCCVVRRMIQEAGDRGGCHRHPPVCEGVLRPEGGRSGVYKAGGG